MRRRFLVHLLLRFHRGLLLMCVAGGTALRAAHARTVSGGAPASVAAKRPVPAAERPRPNSPRSPQAELDAQLATIAREVERLRQAGAGADAGQLAGRL